ncbi:MAG: site-specific integrase [Gemmatimonadota bacterium]
MSAPIPPAGPGEAARVAAPAATPRAFLVERFADHLSLEAGHSPRTIEAYQRDIARLAAFASARGASGPAGVTPTLLREFVYFLKDLGLAPASIRRSISAVRTW